MAYSALRTASQRAAAKAKADEDAKTKDAKAKADDMESSETDEDETDASEGDQDDDDMGDDAPNPPKKGKAKAKAASGGALSPRAAERQRIQAIMGSEEAEGREDLAEHLAYETEMSAKAAVAMLAKAPQAVVQASEPAPRQGRKRFEDAMEATTRGDAAVTAGKGKGAPKALEDQSDEDFIGSVVGFVSQYGLAAAKKG